MSNSTSIPPHFHTVTPHLICAGAADAMAFYQNAFGAIELLRLQTPEGRFIHGCIRIGNSPVMLAEELTGCGHVGPKSLQGSPVFIHLYVEDADAFVARAVAQGAKLVMPVTEMFWGDRYGQIEDPFGHRWSVATHVRDVSPEEMQIAAQAQCR